METRTPISTENPRLIPVKRIPKIPKSAPAKVTTPADVPETQPQKSQIPVKVVVRKVALKKVPKTHAPVKVTPPVESPGVEVEEQPVKALQPVKSLKQPVKVVRRVKVVVKAG